MSQIPTAKNSKFHKVIIQRKTHNVPLKYRNTQSNKTNPFWLYYELS